MEGMRFSELHCREVINLCDGARLGEVSDLVFDPVCGQITAIGVPGRGGLVGVPPAVARGGGRGCGPRADARGGEGRDAFGV